MTLHDIADKIAFEVSDYFKIGWDDVTKSELDYVFFACKNQTVNVGENVWYVSLEVTPKGFYVYLVTPKGFYVCLYSRDIHMLISRNVDIAVYPFHMVCYPKRLEKFELENWLNSNEEFAKFYRFVQELDDKYYGIEEA